MMLRIGATRGCAAALIVLSSRALAGPLAPPAGPVAPTPGPEPRIAVNATNTPGDADSVFKITQPGSYYLTGNINGVVGKHGIEIVAIGVTLDLNGFELAGVPAMGAFDGVSATVPNLKNIAVLNGSVRNWGASGVDLGSSASNGRVDGVRASVNAGNGISVGIGCAVSNCSAYLNSLGGIATGTGCTVFNCSAYGNAGNGIGVATGGTVSFCSAYENLGYGISANDGSTVSNCSAALNGSNGITTTSGCTVTNCSANQNSARGISTHNGSTVADCTARANTLDGIACVSGCVIRGNNCQASGLGGDGAGIYASGSDTRVEGNNCTSADRGIHVDDDGNIIIRNTCAGNGINWVIVANNVVGPIIDRTAPASAAISGDSAPDSTGSTHPNANFTY